MSDIDFLTSLTEETINRLVDVADSKVYADRVMEHVGALGRNDVLLDGLASESVQGYMTFDSVLKNGDKCSYIIEGFNSRLQNNGQFEIGVGLWNSAEKRLVRQTILFSSNVIGNGIYGKVNFIADQKPDAGYHKVWNGFTASDIQSWKTIIKAFTEGILYVRNANQIIINNRDTALSQLKTKYDTYDADLLQDYTTYDADLLQDYTTYDADLLQDYTSYDADLLQDYTSYDADLLQDYTTYDASMKNLRDTFVNTQYPNAVADIDSHRDSGIEAVDTKTNTSIQAVEDKRLESVNAVSAQQTASVNAVSAQQTASVNAVSAQQTASVNAVITQQGNSINEINKKTYGLNSSGIVLTSETWTEDGSKSGALHDLVVVYNEKKEIIDGLVTTATNLKDETLGYKNQASTSATNASTSEANALTYKNQASTSATNASTSEKNAKTSEQNALTYKNQASTSATNASTSEANALTYKNQAKSYADNLGSGFTGATATTDGSTGIVPKPLKADYQKFLRGDGTWAVVKQPDFATTETAGLVKIGSGLSVEEDGTVNAQAGVKVGHIFNWSGSTAPEGAFPCDGRELSRSLYSELFSVIGTAWGTGDGATTFNIPNLTGYLSFGTGEKEVLVCIQSYSAFVNDSGIKTSDLLSIFDVKTAQCISSLNAHTTTVTQSYTADKTELTTNWNTEKQSLIDGWNTEKTSLTTQYNTMKTSYDAMKDAYDAMVVKVNEIEALIGQIENGTF